ncbi:MAG: hypothetical protein IJF19_00410 [Clostridia bacterium]|nr:hypothetical protein [Clostridia bacterium]
MPSTNKTANLGLNQWTQSDRPMRNDFNNDNSIVDSVLGGHVGDMGIHVTPQEKQYLTDPMAVQIYTGDGTAQRTLTASVEFRFVVVFAKSKPFGFGGKVYSAVGYLGMGCSTGLSISASGSGFTVSQNDEACLNESGVEYRAVLIK